MLPATNIPSFRVDDPDQTADDVLVALRGLGDSIEIPRRLIRVLIEYLRRYTLDDDEQTPSFAGGRLLVAEPGPGVEPTDEQFGLDTVEGYASSITLTLAALGFAKVFRTRLTRSDLVAETDELERLASYRLTAAMAGLLRSFTINVFASDSPAGVEVLRMVNQADAPRRRVVEGLRFQLRDTMAGLRDLNLGISSVQDLDVPDRLFECGWSWGPTQDAPEIPSIDGGRQRAGYAIEAPYLYFTVVALDAIAELFSQRTQVLALISDDQSRLLDALRKRWDLTQRYWSTLASFGRGRWPVEDIPWRTTDGYESDYFSLLVTSIAARDLASQRDTDLDLTRLGDLLGELGNRGRVTRRPTERDPAAVVHHPGMALRLEGAENFGPALAWQAIDFAPLLLKRTFRLAQLINGIELRSRLLILADAVWQHIEGRRSGSGPFRDLWDQPGQIFSDIDAFKQPSWHHTLRVVESLVIAANVAAAQPLRSLPLSAHAEHLLTEAEHLYDQELVAGSDNAGRLIRDRTTLMGIQLRRAREILPERPATATALLVAILQELDVLASAREDVFGTS